MHRTNIVVTGLALATPLALGRERSWSALRAGRTAFWPLRMTEWPDEPAHYGGVLRHRLRFKPGFDPINALVDALMTEACSDAFADGLWPRLEIERAAVVVSLSKGRITSLETMAPVATQADFNQPNEWVKSWPDGAASTISQRFRTSAASLAPVAACASGLIAAIQGADLIRRGVCDMAFVGALDASITPFILSAFRKMKALARVEDDPARSVRPWDRRRSGFLAGEGGAILVLEREDHARARGVLPYAEFAGGSFGSDAYHITDLNPDPSGLAHIIGLALKNGDMQPNELDYVNVHGTATRQNDPLECRAIRKALGSHADSVSCSANKAQIGHLLGAAGAAELAITCLAIRDGFVPPTLNLDDPDPACDLDGTPHIGKAREIRAALKISIGFGGHLAASVLRRPSGPRRPPIPLNPSPDSP